MRKYTVERTVYKFEELSDKAKEAAISNLYDINVDHDWWDSTYEDAKTIGCRITGFDTGRGSQIDFELTDGDIDVCEAILRHHGESCSTHALAKEHLKTFKDLTKLTESEDDTERWGAKEALEALTEEFTRALGEEFLCMLRREYEYQTSEDAIMETIEANEYEFTEDGKLA